MPTPLFSKQRFSSKSRAGAKSPIYSRVNLLIQKPFPTPVQNRAQSQSPSTWTTRDRITMASSTTIFVFYFSIIAMAVIHSPHKAEATGIMYSWRRGQSGPLKFQISKSRLVEKGAIRDVLLTYVVLLSDNTVVKVNWTISGKK